MLSKLFFALAALTVPVKAEDPRVFKVAVVCAEELMCDRLAQVWLQGAHHFESDLGRKVRFESMIILNPRAYSEQGVLEIKRNVDLIVGFVDVLERPEILGRASGIAVIGAQPSSIFIAVRSHDSAYGIAQTVHHELGHVFGARHTDMGAMFWAAQSMCTGFSEESVKAIRAHLNSLPPRDS